MTNSIEKLETRIRNGEDVTPAELAEAYKNAEAEKSIALLKEAGAADRKISQLKELEVLKLEAKNAKTPKERMEIGYQISDMEKQINADK